MAVASRHRSRLVVPDTFGAKPSSARLRQAVRRALAIRERLMLDAPAPLLLPAVCTDLRRRSGGSGHPRNRSGHAQARPGRHWRFRGRPPGSLRHPRVAAAHAAGGGRGRRPHPIGRRRAAAVLGRRSSLPVAGAAEGAGLEPGKVYVAPPDRHVLVHETDSCRSRPAPSTDSAPPSIPSSAARPESRGPGVIGVILSGALDDGADGLVSHRSRRSIIAIVQIPTMPKWPACRWRRCD